MRRALGLLLPCLLLPAIGACSSPEGECSPEGLQKVRVEAGETARADLEIKTGMLARSYLQINDGLYDIVLRDASGAPVTVDVPDGDYPGAFTVLASGSIQLALVDRSFVLRGPLGCA